jgi:hypothetical protein
VQTRPSTAIVRTSRVRTRVITCVVGGGR